MANPTNGANGLWHFQLFGGLRARQVGAGQAGAERVISRFRTQSTGALLAYLAFHKGRSHTREILIELLWPDAPIDSGRHNLSNALSSLRSQLEPPGVPAGAVIVADRLTVELNPAAFATDVEAFEAALRQAAQARATEAQKAEALSQAVEVYDGPLLPGYYEAWITGEQERLSQRFRDAALQLVRLHERRGDLEGALSFARRAASAESFPDEETSREMIRLLLARGDLSAALREYRDLERHLREEFDTEPDAGAPPDPPAHLALSTRETPRTPPSGTVTLLAIDFGPTDAGPTATDLPTRHLREECDRHRGYPAGDAGSALLFAFARASDALACAVAGQKAVADAAPVRMALHTAEAVPDQQSHYQGPAVACATAILAAAHDRQILCSGTTAELLRRDPATRESGVTLADLGLYRLRGQDSPERLFQVRYLGLAPDAFPAPAAERADTAGLPLSFTRFFGREEEIARLSEMILGPDARLITLTGPGGTGKTRLALEVAGQLREELSEAVWFVPLADLADPSLIAGAIVDTLGLSRAGDVEPLDQIVTALSARPASLLVLDNFEHLLGRPGSAEGEAGTSAVQTLRERVPTLTVLVTSRQILHLPVEREFAVPPLPTPNGHGDGSPEQLSLYESVRLFVDRAQAAKPDFQITPHNAPAVAELCDRLEGIPLAIELAAARAGVLTPHQMLSLLSDRFELLVSRKRGVAARQRTLRATLDWSYRLLDPALQRFFASLSVFRGGWDLEAAEAVLEEPLALDYLAQLRDASLIRAEGGVSAKAIRFGLLETLREYGWEQPEPARRRHLQERHAAHFEERLSRPGHEVLPWLDREHDNLRSALEWCLSEEGDLERAARMAGILGVVWSSGFHWKEGRRRLAAVLERYTAPTEMRAGLLNIAGGLARQLGDYRGAEALGGECLSLYRALGNQEAVAIELQNLASLAFEQGKNSAGRAYLEEALAICRGRDDKASVAFILGPQFGQLAREMGDFERARALYAESLALYEELGDEWSVGHIYGDLGLLALAQHDYAGACAWIERCMAPHRSSDAFRDQQRVAHALTHLTKPLLRLKDLEGARRAGEEALALFRALGDKGHIPFCLEHLAAVAVAEGDYAAARARREEALAIRRELENPGDILRALWSLSGVELLTGDIPRARSLLGECLKVLGDNDADTRLRQRWHRDILFRSGMCDIHEGEHASARAQFVECAALGRLTDDHSSQCFRTHVVEAFAILATAERKPERAARLFGAVDAAWEGLGERRDIPGQREYERLVAGLRDALGSAAFDAFYQQGRALSLDDALTFALGE